MGQDELQTHHVVLFPYHEQSHVTPIFALARALASRGLQVTCALPASRYASYSRSAANKDERALFRVEVVAEVETMMNDMHMDFHMLSKKVEEGLEQLLRSLQPAPTCLVSDLLYPWSQELADRLSIPRFQFSPYPATSYMVGCNLPHLVQKDLLPYKPDMKEVVIDSIPGLLKGFRVGDIPMDFLARTAKELEIIGTLHNSKKGGGLVINTSHALEMETLDALAAQGLRIYPVGPMFTIDWASNTVHRDSSLYSEDEECLRWLDGQPTGSVVYASFGSIISLTEEDIQELALGLEASGQPFLWVIRSAANGIDPKSALPTGFEERNKGRGCIISWAPQTAVLSHPSVGCFLCHCGYGSILEALWTGVPMLGGFYKISDQNTNFKLITDGWGVAMPLVQGDCDVDGKGVQPLRHSIEEGIKELMHGSGGARVKQNCARLKAALREAVGPGGSSQCSLDRLANDISGKRSTIS
ncbi:hypothetical protein GOP47_0004239 [Adiantum capillus-veneris]|uniref:Glycosyltransferase n=1 Tax=Adiantum capillus-veneris TaxID=13818 RepID=A0A9D4ZPJ2_ADICA|nr:hypothetical protein GOP47_0004239 [Adiantum capillus-veneris]